MSNPFSDYSRIRMLWPDHLGLARGKYVPARLADRGSAFCVTTFAMSYDRDLIDAPHAYLVDGLKDVHGELDATTLRPSWEDDHTGVAIAHLTLAATPYEASSRAALQRSIESWAAMGYRAKIGIELEGYLLEPNGEGGWQRYQNPRSMVYGTGPLGDPSGFFDDVMFTAERCGFSIESANVEFDESQFEFTLEYGDALRAVDDVFVFKVMVRELAIKRGLDFTFLGKPFPEVSGSGLHLNISFLDDQGRPAFADPDDEHGMSDLARQCVAGLVEHHQAITPILAPTINAYRRLQPGSLAGCWANWGVDHRNVTNRVPAHGGSAMRVESRLGDGAMNVHLGATAVLEAARLGVIDNLDTPPTYTGDGFEDGGDGVARSADSLQGALDHLEADTTLRTSIGDGIIDNFIANKRREVERFEASGQSIDGPELSPFEREMYLPYH